MPAATFEPPRKYWRTSTRASFAASMPRPSRCRFAPPWATTSTMWAVAPRSTMMRVSAAVMASPEGSALAATTTVASAPSRMQTPVSE